MHLTDLEVVNFRAISLVRLEGLSDVVVIAGPNGCGKSCVLDAIRLLKSAYGSYIQDEFQHWFNEFQLTWQEPQALLSLFQDRTKELRITASFVLSAIEKQYLREHLVELIIDRKWMEVEPGRMARAQPSFAQRQRIEAPRIEREAKAAAEVAMRDLDRETLTAAVSITPTGDAHTAESPLLEVVFSVYEPTHLGIIDYHGAHRNYSRERIGNINLTLEGSEDRLKQHALYNSGNKYNNLKSEMAGSYIRHLMVKTASPSASIEDTLTATLQELFSTFFAGKEFVGPRPNAEGRLDFPVRLSNGCEHDIDELSSGEKEILYGYLRLINSSPRNSIIMIDEPELHLNPRLLGGLATFYHKHLGRALANQLWMVTHSDTLIREAVANGQFSVFHMQPAGFETGDGQAVPIRADQELERAVIDLVGDLAAYRPGSKLVIFESTEAVSFDARVVRTLFPTFDRHAAVLSAGEKTRVEGLYDLLERMRQRGHLPMQVYAITDRDADCAVVPSSVNHQQWDVYHIENYLLEPQYILRVCQELAIAPANVKDAADVTRLLRECAEETIPSLVARRMRDFINRTLVTALELRIDLRREDVPEAFDEAIARSAERFDQRRQNTVSKDALVRMHDEFRTEFAASLRDGTWAKEFRGRDIVKRFVSKIHVGMQYEHFRDLILARMRDGNYQPEGMKAVIERILSEGPVRDPRAHAGEPASIIATA